MFSTLTILTALAALTGPAPQGLVSSPALRASLPGAAPQIVRASGTELAASTQRPQGRAVELAVADGQLQPVPAASAEAQPGEEVGSPRASEPPPRRDVAILQNCLISLIEDIDLASQEDGLLTSIEAREGMHVQKDLQLAQVDDREAQARHSAAVSAHRRAKTEAENDVNIRFAEASADAARADYDQGLEVNAKVPNSVVVSEMRRRKLAWDKAVLSIEQAKMEQQKARHEMEAKAEEMELAKLGIDRRKIVSPLGGLVVAVKKRPGAWITKGEPLLRVVRMDRLRVAGHVNAAHYGPHEVAGRAVTIRAHLERGRTERFSGKITFVHPEQNGGDYLVWAEVDNRQLDEQWVLRPGLHVDMAIHLANPAVASGSSAAASR
jgi:macrolide-specific efflux system membrane fusion protein